MKYLNPIIFATMGLISGIAGIVFHDHFYLALLLYLLAWFLLGIALLVGNVDNLPKPHIIVAGYGRLPGTRVYGLLIENDGEAAYNIAPPSPVSLSGAKGEGDNRY